MNKTTVFVTFGVLAGLGIVGTLLLQIYRPEASAVFTSFVIQTLGLASVAAATFYGLGKVGEKVDQVQKQTNGTLTALRAENDRLTRENVELAKQLPPEV